jgi:hypothetical protein
MNGIVTGRIMSSGESQYGPWAIVAEPEVTTKSGSTFTPRVMCSGKDIPPSGSMVLVTGLVMAKVSEKDGKHYANLSLSYCRFTPLAGDGHEVTEADFAGDDDGEPCPF